MLSHSFETFFLFLKITFLSFWSFCHIFLMPWKCRFTFYILFHSLIHSMRCWVGISRLKKLKLKLLKVKLFLNASLISIQLQILLKSCNFFLLSTFLYTSSPSSSSSSSSFLLHSFIHLKRSWDEAECLFYLNIIILLQLGFLLDLFIFLFIFSFSPFSAWLFPFHLGFPFISFLF